MQLYVSDRGKRQDLCKVRDTSSTSITFFFFSYELSWLVVSVFGLFGFISFDFYSSLLLQRLLFQGALVSCPPADFPQWNESTGYQVIREGRSQGVSLLSLCFTWCLRHGLHFASSISQTCCGFSFYLSGDPDPGIYSFCFCSSGVIQLQLEGQIQPYVCFCK